MALIVLLFVVDRKTIDAVDEARLGGNSRVNVFWWLCDSRSVVCCWDSFFFILLIHFIADKI